MADDEQLATLIRGAAAWNKWRLGNPDVAIDLEAANLKQIKLEDANLKGADFSGANFKNARLANSSLRDAYRFSIFCNLANSL